MLTKSIRTAAGLRPPSSDQAVASPIGHGDTHLLARIADGDLQQLDSSVDLRPVADEAMDLGQVGHAATHVFEGAAVDLLVRHELRSSLLLSHMLADALGELEDRDLFVAADVEDLAVGLA